MSQDDRPKRNSGHAFREVGEDGGLVVVPQESKVEVLNPVASKIYSMLDGSNTHEQIVQAVVDEFDVSEEDARRDLEAFLAQLEEHKMLAPAAGGTQGGSVHE